MKMAIVTIRTLICLVVFLFISSILFTTAEEEEDDELDNSIRDMKFKVIKGIRVQQMDMRVKNASSRSHCAVLCTSDTCCLQANYNHNVKVCQMLRYHEIPSQRIPDSQWNALLIDCPQQPVMPSPPCQEMVHERGASEFMTVEDYILKGNDDGLQYGIGLEECRDYCLYLEEFQCRSIDYIESTQRCQASRSTRDDEGKTLQIYSGGIYEQRICER